jgi:mono/diheme cytochrome c family protein
MPVKSHLRRIALTAPVALLVWVVGSFLFATTLRISGPRTAWAQDPAQLEEGARIYAENCAVCHGADGQGRVGATLAKDWPSIRPDLCIKTTIENGITGTPMVAWSQANGGPLTGEQIDALVAYILTWETGGPREILPSPTFVPARTYSPIPDVEGDPNRGAALYVQNCAVCHGESGQGRVGATLAKNFPSIRPDLTVKSAISNGIAGSPMPAWSQANGGPLSEVEINDLTAFVLVLPGNSQVTQVVPATQTPAELNPWLTGWGGLALAVFVFLLLVGIILWSQSRRKA